MTGPETTIICGRVVTMDALRTIINDGAVCIQDGRIAAVGKRHEVLDRFPGASVLNQPGAIVLPGFIDTHTHVSQSLVRGMIAHELPMIYRIYVHATAHMTPDMVGTAARLCMTQLLCSGVTTVCEGSVGADDDAIEAIIDAALDTGIRCNIVRGIGDQDFHHAALYSQTTEKSWRRKHDGKAERDLEKTVALLERFGAGSEAQITAAVCASGITNYSETYFREAFRIAERYATKLHTHAARDREEVEFSMAVYGRRPIEYLESIGVLSHRSVLAHAMLATEAEMVTMGRAGCGVAHSAAECLNILNAIPNVKMMRALGVNVGLGCDNAANDMLQVMKAAWSIHIASRGIQNYDPEVLTADDILSMATIDAAKVLGLDRITGSLEVGKAADIVVLDGSAPHMAPTQSLVAEIVRYASRAEVQHVFVGGRHLVQDKELQSIDMKKLSSEAAAAATSIQTRAASQRYRSLCC